MTLRYCAAVVSGPIRTRSSSEGIADRQRFGRRDQPVEQGLGDPLACDQQPRGGRAHLAAVVEDTGCDALDRMVEVGILEHQDRRLAAELEADALACRGPPRPSPARPTALLPVNEILATSWCATSGAPTAGPVPTTMLRTPGGSPTSSAIAPSSSSTSGVISEGLSTTVQPAASAGATFQEVVTSGKFQGTISAATPAGSKRTAAREAASGSGTGVALAARRGPAARSA